MFSLIKTTASNLTPGRKSKGKHEQYTLQLNILWTCIQSIFCIISAYIVFLYWVLVYAQKTRNTFSGLVIIGFSSVLFIHLVVNMGMIIGLLPVTGLPAPFLSYGGSFLLTCLFMIGMINNITIYDV